MYVEYTSNNSGARWWLSDDNWKALEEAGWDVFWIKDNSERYMLNSGSERFLGALATEARRYITEKDLSGLMVGASNEDILNTVVARWESIVKQYAGDSGCRCCGPPHSFKLVDKGQVLMYYDSLEYDW